MKTNKKLLYIGLIVIVLFVALFTVGTSIIWQQSALSPTFFIGLNSHQAMIVVDNGRWTAIIPNPNGQPFQFHSSNYTEVIQWAMNQTK